jgi:hypothetical protein
MGNKLVANSDHALVSVLATLEECRAVLIGGSSRETAQLLSLAILDLRMKLNHISEAELKALCDEMSPEDGPGERSAQPALRRRPALRLVK